jgi:DNA-binding ferritin-like protein
MKKESKNPCSEKQKRIFIDTFLEMVNLVKLYHWKTKEYSVHKATDELKERLEYNVDRFVEILIGKCGSRLTGIQHRVRLIDIRNTDSLRHKIFEYRGFLVDFNNILDKNVDSELFSVRDDILGDINQFLYLLTFNE